MRIYQQHRFEGHFLLTPGTPDMNSGTILDLSALLNLVIPSYDAPSSSVEMVQTHSYDSLVYPSPAPMYQSLAPPLPIFPYQDVHGFDFCAQSFPVPSEDVRNISLVTCNGEPFLGGSEPLTSFLRPDPELSVEVPSLKPESGEAQRYTLTTPLEVLLPMPKPVVKETKAAKGHQRLQGHHKPRPKCVINGCTTQQQSHGRCIRHGGGKRCVVSGCSSGAQTMGLCKRHGGGSRCNVLGCGKSSQSGGLCRSHGGGMLCIAPGCKKGAQRQGKCAKHAPKKCVMDGCSSLNRSGGFCSRHRPLNN